MKMDILKTIHSRFSNTPALSLSFAYLAFGLIVSCIFWWNKFDTYTFGFEYGNVAASLASGNGFSDLLGTSSGPTAWCPPFYVSIHATIFFIFGVKTLASFWALLILRVFILAYSLYLLLNINYSETLNNYRYWLLPIFSVFTTLIILKDFDDKSLNVFASILMMYFYSRIRASNISKYTIPLFLFFFILALSNLFLLIGGVLFLAGDAISKWAFRNSRVPVKVSILLLIAVVIPTILWGIRNQITMGKFIPYKSNLWFEVYLSNVVDDDGIMKQSNWYQHHPLSKSLVGEHYIEKGELQFIRQFEEASKEYLAHNPLDYVRKILNRTAHALIFTTPSLDIEEISPSKISDHDLRILETSRYIIHSKWTNFNMSASEFNAQLLLLDLEDRMLIETEWLMKKRNLSYTKFNDIPNVIAGLLVSIFPMGCLVFCLFTPSLRNNAIFRATLFLLIICLSPYILISHYARYQFFQIGFFTIIVFFTMATVLSNYRTKQEQKTVSES